MNGRDPSIRTGQTPTKPPLHYSRAAMLFHWSIAALIFVEFALGLSFSRFNPGDAWYFRGAYRLHMSAGMPLVVLGAASVVWRLSHIYPALPRGMHAAVCALAKLAHTLLYLFIVTVPLSGWAILSLRNAPVGIVGKLTWPNIAYLAHMTHEQRVRIHDFLLPMHSKLSYIGIGLVGLHIAAALYHHFLRGDEVLKRMLPRARNSVSLGPQ